MGDCKMLFVRDLQTHAISLASSLPFGTAFAYYLGWCGIEGRRCVMMFASETSKGPRVLVTRGAAGAESWVERLADSIRPVPVEIVSVTSPARALQRLASVRPRVVVVDQLSLTDLGWPLLRQIRRLDVDMACLMVVRQAEPELLHKALQMSAYSVFEAPVDVDLMGRMVCRLVRRAEGG